jgi:hypothetical protein
VPSDTCTRPGLAKHRQQLLVAQDVGHAGVDAPLDRQVALDELFAEGDELLAVDRRLLVGQDEEADLVVRTRFSISSTTFFGSRMR